MIDVFRALRCAFDADHEIPSEEFLKAAKKKRRVFTEQINKLVDKVRPNFVFWIC
jgi:hypothetical protein